MTRQRISQSVGWTLAVVALLFAWTAVHPVAAAQGKVMEKTKKQIRVMEGMLDSVLLDSPNLLVAGSHVAHGVYLDEFGVVLSFEASLTGEGFDFGRSLSFLKNLRIESDKDKTVIWHEGSGESDTLEQTFTRQAEEKARQAEKKAAELEEKLRKSEDKMVVLKKGDQDKLVTIHEGDSAKNQKEIYEKGRQELLDALVDYGETLTTLRDDQWVAIAAFLKDSEYFKDQQISRLVMKARMRDLRASDQISRDALLSRIVVEEY